MGLFDFIRKLQQKPKRTRQRIALGVSAGITLVIFSVWGVTLVELQQNNATVATESASGQAASPLVSLKNSVSRTYRALTQKFNGTSTPASVFGLEEQSDGAAATSTAFTPRSPSPRGAQPSSSTTTATSSAEGGFSATNTPQSGYE